MVTKALASGWLSANVAPKNGHVPEGVRGLGEEIDKLGYNRLTLKFNQEPAIGSLVSAVIRERHQDSSVGESPVGEHQSNEVVERAVKSIQGQARILKLALEARVRARVKEHLDVALWLIRYAAMLINIGQRGADGRSAWGLAMAEDSLVRSPDLASA